jgi:hypothetical protein
MNTSPAAHTSAHVILRQALAGITLAITLLAGGCGGGGGGTPAVNGVAPNLPAAANSLAVTGDDYGMTSPNYLAAGKSSLGVILRSAVANSLSDPDFKTISRIDLPAGFSGSGTYSLGAGTATTAAFPGALYFFNGHPSTLLSTVGGTITFTACGSNSGDRVTGSYHALVQDGADSASPKPVYSITASFDFTVEQANAVLPAPPAASLAAASYDTNCAACHALGNYDTTRSGASDLALKGGKLPQLFAAGVSRHQNITLGAGEISALQVLLNSN